MKRSRMTWAVVAAVALLFVFYSFQAIGSQKTKAKTNGPVATVRGGALGNSIQVLGELDEPLGMLLTLRGNMLAEETHRKGVSADETFIVHQVGDRTLSEPIEIDLGYRWHGKDEPVAPGTRLELIGYERGGFAGIAPAENQWRNDARNKKPVGPPQSKGWHFEISFVVLQFDELPAGE